MPFAGTAAVLLTSLAAACTTTSSSRLPEEETSVEDPFLWLEDLRGEEALDWVRERNATTERLIAERAGFSELRDSILAIYDSDERIPYVRKQGEYYYNFWRDEAHARGLWRRCTLDEYRKTEPSWEVLLDLDALAAAEEENWVWSGSSCRYPDYDRCIIALSRGGADATVHREFDLESLRFVEDGFNLPEAKGRISWIDRDTVYVSTDFGEGSMTHSGYPRIVKRWSRGTPLEEAEVVFEGEPSDVSVGAWHDPTPGFERDFVHRGIAFYDVEQYLLRPDGSMVRIEVPNSANAHVFRHHLVVRPRDDWEVGGATYPSGSLLVIDFDAFLQGARDFELLFEPTETSSLLGWSYTLDHVLISVLEDVRNEIRVLTPGPGGWSREPLLGAPELGTLSVSAVDSRESNAYFLTATDFLTPTTLFHGEIGSAPEKLKSLPSFFDSEGLVVSQHFVVSADGTRVPYFMIAPEEVSLDGNNPTLVTAYGGFEISLLPTYAATAGRAWLTEGGVYVIANIRGGGEYGPRWHRAALKANRPRAYEDLAAVARDLAERGVASSERIGISGGSNGGLMVGNMITSYPELFGAAVCSMPLLDMKRYHLLLAGASWMAEYGDPDDPEEWAFIRSFSPYHNLRDDGSYPVTFFDTSTRDDRVHPGHARKMMALMEAQGHEAYYYENIEGGHGGAADNSQAAHRQALIYSFLKARLFPREEIVGTE